MNTTAPDTLVMQCPAVIARSPAGLLTTLAVQKWLPSLPFFQVKSAPTAGVPLNDIPLAVTVFDAARSRTAPVTCETRSVAAPLAGVTVTTTPAESTPTIASRPDGRVKMATARRAATCRPARLRARNFTSASFPASLPILNCDGQVATVPEVSLQ